MYISFCNSLLGMKILSGSKKNQLKPSKRYKSGSVPDTWQITYWIGFWTCDLGLGLDLTGDPIGYPKYTKYFV